MNNYNYTIEDAYNSIGEKGYIAVESARKLYESEVYEVEKHSTLKTLAENHLVDMIQRNVNYTSIAFPECLDGAKKWLEISKTKYDRRRHYVEKDWHDRFVRHLENGLQVTGIEIKSIVICGYDNYAYNVVFTISEYDYVFEIQIPMINHLTASNRKYTCDGKLGFGYNSSPSFWRTSWWSYNLADFHNAIIEITTLDKHKDHVSKSDYIVR